MCFVRYLTHLFTVHSPLMETRLIVSSTLLCYKTGCFRVCEDNSIWQQDGAPPHKSRQVSEYLNQILPNRWLGRHGPDLALLSWPPR